MSGEKIARKQFLLLEKNKKRNERSGSFKRLIINRIERGSVWNMSKIGS